MNKENIKNSLNKITITPGGIGIYDGSISIMVTQDNKKDNLILWHCDSCEHDILAKLNVNCEVCGEIAKLETYIKQGKILKGISINPKDINSLPDQTAAIIQEFVRDYFVKNVSLNKSKYKNMKMEPQLKEELNYKYKLKLWKLEIIWR